MLKQLWLVTGTCGEYSDRREWTVRAFLSQEKAQAYVARIEEVLAANGCRKHRDEWHLPDEQRYANDSPARVKVQELDPYFSTDYTGTSYVVVAVDLDDTP